MRISKHDGTSAFSSCEQQVTRRIFASSSPESFPSNSCWSPAARRRKCGKLFIIKPQRVRAILTGGALAALALIGMYAVESQGGFGALAKSQAPASSSVISTPAATPKPVIETSPPTNTPTETRTDINGTYDYTNTEVMTGDLNVQETADGVSLKISVVRSTGGNNICDFDSADSTAKGIAKRDGDKVTWSGNIVEGEQCSLEITFSGDKAEVKQNGDCGCGAGVTMDGKFTRAK
jgi:hypothetical protein